MARHIALLRGINLGSRNRIAMAELRSSLEAAGFEDVRTHLQSGNAVLTSKGRPDEVARECERVISERFGLDIAVVARTRAELARIVRRDPLGDVAADPKRYQVGFLAAELDRETVRRLEAAAAPEERLVVARREIYAWHPAGVARSRLWTLLGGRRLGVTATARNWSTVTSLLELASD